MFQTAIAHAQAWIDEPFRKPVSAYEIVLGVGLIMIALIAWGRVTRALGPTL